MQTVPLHDSQGQASHITEAHLQEGRWTSRIRVERRRECTFYSITFSNNGRTVASLRGGFTPLPLTDAAAAIQAEAISVATDWLAHVGPDKSSPASSIKKLHHIRNQTNPNNRQSREHRSGRRAA